MGATLAVPLSWLVEFVVGSGSLPTCEQNSSGFWYELKRLFAYFWMRYDLAGSRPRFDLYDYKANGNAAIFGAVAHSIEWEHELPRGLAYSPAKSDEVIFFGVNSNGDSLFVRASIGKNDELETWLELRFTDGRRLTTPNAPFISTGPDRRDESFKGGGLNLSCQSPMRRWRLTFNGALMESDCFSPRSWSPLVHVKFSFTWSTVSQPFDFTYDTPIGLLVTALAQKPWKKYFPEIDRLRQEQDIYEQSGHLIGNVIISDEETKELTLWGAKIRKIATGCDMHDPGAVDIFAITKNGTFVHLKKQSCEFASSILSGYGRLRSGETVPVTWTDFAQLPEDGEVPHEFEIQFKADIPCLLKVTTEDPVRKIPSMLPVPHHIYSAFTAIVVNGEEGRGLVLFKNSTNVLGGAVNPIPTRPIPLPQEPPLPFVPPLVVSLEDDVCRLPELSGAKGSSLAHLMWMSKYKQQISVPKGFVVTTAAYDELLAKNELLQSLIITLQDSVARNRSAEGTVWIYERIQYEMLNHVNPIIHAAIVEQYDVTFGSRDRPLVVRASASGDDCSDMSITGQMQTFLGIQGKKQLLDAVFQCWASQFGPLAIDFKRQNGKQVSFSMAVVVQEFIPSDVSGVMFTCDPVNGNPDFVTIAANFSQGETFNTTSNLCEPDTLIFKKNYEGDEDIELYDIIIGNKKIKLDGFDDEQASDVTDCEQTVCCLLTEEALKLARLGIQIDDYYGSPRDLEWAMYQGKIYFLQTRPVSGVECNVTDFEVLHELDGAFQSEHEFFGSANIREILPGALCPLDVSFLLTCTDLAAQRQSLRQSQNNSKVYCTYYRRSVATVCNHPVFRILNAGLLGASQHQRSKLEEAAWIAIFGTCTQYMKEISNLTSEQCTANNTWTKISNMLRVFKAMSGTEVELEKTKSKYWNYAISVSESSSAKRIYEIISKKLTDICDPTYCHLNCSLTSSVYNITLLSQLAELHGDWKPEVFVDFARLVSPCLKDSELDIPSQIKNLSATISRCVYHRDFHDWETEVALEWLQMTTSPASESFQEFLEKHGHRCFREYEVRSIPWEIKPTPIVKILQEMLKDSVELKTTSVNSASLDAVLNLLSCPLSAKTKRNLKALAPKCRKAIALREASKSLFVRVVNAFRNAYCHLARALVSENRIPDEELIYFLTHEEIGILLRTRSSLLLAKAIHRQRLHKQMDLISYPLLSKGIPIPVTEITDSEDNESQTDYLGIPICPGIAQGRAKVISDSVPDITNIQKGDILIARSVDTAWAPFFPVLSGLVTEIGGPLSHGGAMARECGVPSIFGVRHATRIFRTGQQVMVNANLGRVIKIGLSDPTA